MRFMATVLLSIVLLCLVIDSSVQTMKRTESFVCIEIEQDEPEYQQESEDCKFLGKILQKLSEFEELTNLKYCKAFKTVIVALNCFCKKKCKENWNLWISFFEEKMNQLGLKDELIKMSYDALLEIETFDDLYLRPSEVFKHYLTRKKYKSSVEAGTVQGMNGTYRKAFITGNIYEEPDDGAEESDDRAEAPDLGKNCE